MVNSPVTWYNLHANACKGFLKCPFLAELYAPPSSATRPLCSDPHCFLIFCISVHVWPSSERHWLWSNAYWPRLPSSNCRCILPSFNTDASLGALAQQIHNWIDQEWGGEIDIPRSNNVWFETINKLSRSEFNL